LLQRVCVRPHIDEDLDNRKHLYNGVDAVLVSKLPSADQIPFQHWANAAQSKVAEGISPTVPQDYATSLNVVYFPQLGEAHFFHDVFLVFPICDRLPRLRPHA
jgi:DNA mismatch repair protein MSH5